MTITQAGAQQPQTPYTTAHEYTRTRAPLAHRPLAIIRLRGTQEDMGAQHAAALRQLGGYRALIDFYSEFIERVLLRADSSTRPGWPVRGGVRALGEVLAKRIERDRPAEYLARSRAFMVGLDMPATYTRHLMIMDVLQNLVGLAGRFRVGPFARVARRGAMPACSTLMAWGAASRDGAMLHARNFDFPGIGIWDRRPAVVFCEPDHGLRYGFVTTRGADTPGVSAFNEAGITVTMHTRFHRDVAFRGAAVVDIGHDIARRAASIDDAVAIVRERASASTWGMAVSSAREQRAVVIETTAKTVAVVEPRPASLAEHLAEHLADGLADHLSCANRYRHATTMAGQVSPSPAWEGHSSSRQQSLRAQVDAARARGGMTVADMQAALDGHVDAGAPDMHRGAGSVVAQACTVKSIVVAPDARAVHVSVGPAPTSRGPYVEVPWDWHGEVGGRELEQRATNEATTNEAMQTIDVIGEREPETEAETDSEPGRAHEHYTEATRLDRQADNWRATLREMERAVALQPRDPSYRFLAGVLRMRAREPREALMHLAAGLETERVPLRRGQLLLWASRAADAVGDRARARAWRGQLLSMNDEQLVAYQAHARVEQGKPFDVRKRKVHVDLLVSDAWGS